MKNSTGRKPHLPKENPTDSGVLKTRLFVIYVLVNCYHNTIYQCFAPHIVEYNGSKRKCHVCYWKEGKYMYCVKKTGGEKRLEFCTVSFLCLRVYSVGMSPMKVFLHKWWRSWFNFHTLFASYSGTWKKSTHRNTATHTHTCTNVMFNWKMLRWMEKNLRAQYRLRALSSFPSSSSGHQLT